MKIIDLGGIWEMEGHGLCVTGHIPGSVYSVLLENHILKDPYFAEGDDEALEYMESDYTFSRRFNIQAPPGCRVLLRCEGLDTLCDILLNGHAVASTRNMHRTYEFDVTELLQSGENSLAVVCHAPNPYFKKMAAEESLYTSQDPLVGFAHLRKAFCMSGWDWGPRLPDAGIFRPISLLVEDSPRIRELRVVQRHENGRVWLTPLVTVEPAGTPVSLTLEAPDGSLYPMADAEEFEVPCPSLWWPNGFGAQPLYRVTARVSDTSGAADERSLRIGLRTLRLIRERDRFGESFCHEVNGVRIFAMGADYIPEDNLLSRITPERTRSLLTLCRDCNFNTVRVWGGGVYPSDDFYDCCDELGLLVFQDCMMACAEVPGREDYSDEFCAEVRDNLLRIRHHACLAVLSGNNEMEEMLVQCSEESKSRYLRLFEDRLPALVQTLCPELPYIPSSPTTCGHFIAPQDENYGDAHYWTVWHGGVPFTEYRQHYFRYLSEFGFESFPSEKTVNSFTSPEERNIFSRKMELHQRCRGGNRKILTYLADTYLYPTDFGVLLYASQLLQADAIRYGVEHLRRNRGRCMGALYWQLNDIWPVASWASVDYFGRPKALQYAAKRFFAPIMISCAETGETDTRPYCVMESGYYGYETKAALNVTNETTEPLHAEVIWSLRRADGSILSEGSVPVSVAPLSSLWLPELDFRKTDVRHNYLSYALVREGEVLSRGSVLFTAPKHFCFVDPHLHAEIEGDTIVVSADAYARAVEIDSPDSDLILEDNYFDMDGGERRVRILQGTPRMLRLRSVYDIR